LGGMVAYTIKVRIPVSETPGFDVSWYSECKHPHRAQERYATVFDLSWHPEISEFSSPEWREQAFLPSGKRKFLILDDW
jgi:hypothetical protein